jgi:hypothetical protein
VSTQLDIFGEAKVEVEKPEPVTEVRLGKRSARYPLRKKRREALTKLIEILKELEGKDIYIGSYEAGGRHFWIDNLKLTRLQLEYYPPSYLKQGDYIPSVVVLREASQPVSEYSLTTWWLSGSRNTRDTGTIFSTFAMASTTPGLTNGSPTTPV